MTHLNENQITELKQLLANPKKIAIIPHRNVDGDALGSTLGRLFALSEAYPDLKANENMMQLTEELTRGC